ncbi:DUF6777 domain-containing protein [Streptomyces sp. W16]|uniref:DUF6777 domain-containing protein n=1 Tax=Streptomyces sp. W16 TaxID=3076631 RepID=UPI00295B7364|nr:DUF6777 domain-containing protein [Streptomyces sp. W16]MDV9173571.1 DUF6777 domain-containing protein [Streptomyces sp. W16]
MSVEPPSSGRPTGPPSGPLSGPSQPPSGPPSQPSGSGGAGAPEPHRPWWKSAPRVAILTTAVVAAVVLALVFTRSDGGSTGTASKGEVFLQAAAKTGPDPFTESTASDSSAPPVSASPTASEPANAVRGVDGGAPGLYGGTQNVASCDVEKQIKALRANPAKNKAFASVVGVQPAGVPAYLRSLTPVQLRMDTRVTNHGYRDGVATSYQAVLQAGTAVLVDSHGVPRVRCACGNPLSPPVAQQTTPKRTGDTWSSYRPQNVVVVTPAPQVINIFVIYDPHNGHWFGRHHGDTGGRHDHRTPPPVNPASPSVTVSPPTSPSSNSPSPCASTAPGTPGTPGTPGASTSPCPPTSSSPSSSSTSPSAPSSSPSSESPSSEPPSTGSSAASSSAPASVASGATTTSASNSASASVSSFSAPVSPGTSSPSLS